MKQGSSGLTLREHQVYQKTTFELVPKKVALWVKSLPMANLGESSKSSYRLLVDVNQAVLDPDKRLAILNILEPVIMELISSLEKQFIINHIALTEKQKKIAALVQALQTEMTIGYHTVIESIVTSDVKRSNKKLLAIALAIAVKYHGMVILRCYQLYASVPRRIWKELYTLYQIALAQEIEQLEVTIEHTKEVTNVHSSFIQILVLSIANPYQMRQKEIAMLWDLLPGIAEHVSLKTHAYNKQHYVIELDSSSPPIHKSLFKPKDSEEIRSFKLTAFTAVDYLNNLLASISKRDQESSRKSMLIRHLIQSWSHGTHRSFARTACEGDLEISIGLSATHYLLVKALAKKETKATGKSNSTLEAKEGSLLNATLLDLNKPKSTNLKGSFDYLSSSGPPNADIWAKLYRTDKEREADASKNLVTNRSRDAIARDNYKFQSVELLNISPSGYCIQVEAEELPKHAQTGEVLGFLEQDDNCVSHWSIGVVRWVRRQAKGTLVQMGIQLLAPGVTPINIQLKNSRGEKNEIHRGLKLPALTGIGQPATIITNPLSFSANSKVRVVELGKEHEVRLCKEIAATSNFRQFSFETVGNVNKEPISGSSWADRQSTDQEDLDGIWDIFSDQ